MPIFAIPGSPMYEEMARRQMLNQSGQAGAIAPQNSNYGTSPITEPNYKNFRSLEQNTGTNYGYIDNMLQSNPSLAPAGYDPNKAGAGAWSGAASSSSRSSGPAGGYDPSALMAAIHSSYDQSRLANRGTGRAYEKRNASNMANRMDGASTGLTHLANRETRTGTDAMLAQNERDRAMAIAQAQKDAAELAMRSQEIQSRDRLTASSRPGGGAYTTPSSWQQGSQQLGGGKSPGQYTSADAWNTGVGAQFSGGRDPGSRIPGSAAKPQYIDPITGLPSGYSPPPTAPPPGAPPDPNAQGDPSDWIRQMVEEMERQRQEAEKNAQPQGPAPGEGQQIINAMDTSRQRGVYGGAYDPRLAGKTTASYGSGTGQSTSGYAR